MRELNFDGAVVRDAHTLERDEDGIVSKLFFELNFKFAFFEFKGVFMLVVKSTGSIWTPELVGRKSIETGSGRNPFVFIVSGSVVGELLVGKFRGSGNMDLNW